MTAILTKRNIGIGTLRKGCVPLTYLKLGRSRARLLVSIRVSFCRTVSTVSAATRVPTLRTAIEMLPMMLTRTFVMTYSMTVRGTLQPVVF